MHLRFEDQQTMIHQTQKRLEELYDLLKDTDRRVLKISSNEQTVNSKLDMIVETLEILRQDSRNGGKKDKRDSPDGNDRGTGDDGSGGGGGSMSLQDRGQLRRAADLAEDLAKSFADLEKEVRSLKSQLSSINGVLSMIQSEMTFKLDKESFEHALEQKLDKEEFYSKFGDAGASDETVKRIELEIRKALKKTDGSLEEMHKKQKKLKKRVEELEENQRTLEEKLKDSPEYSTQPKDKSELPNNVLDFLTSPTTPKTSAARMVGM